MTAVDDSVVVAYILLAKNGKSLAHLFDCVLIRGFLHGVIGNVGSDIEGILFLQLQAAFVRVEIALIIRRALMRSSIIKS